MPQHSRSQACGVQRTEVVPEGRRDHDCQEAIHEQVRPRREQPNVGDLGAQSVCVAHRHINTAHHFEKTAAQARTLAQQGLQRVHQLRQSPCTPPHNPSTRAGGSGSNIAGQVVLGGGAHSRTAPPNSQIPATMMAWNICASTSTSLLVPSPAANSTGARFRRPDIGAGRRATHASSRKGRGTQ